MIMTRFIFITGGVVSSLGKGISAASLAALLQARGYSVRLRKLDPYLNIDPGTMSPYQHGEVFVLEDGSEVDLDFGHYERFTGVPAKKSDSITSGQIYMNLLTKERKGDYLGGTVQVIPHVTDLIKEFILADTEDVDFVLCEIGGTVGDIEGLPFFETIRQLGNSLGKSSVLYMHLTLLPYIAVAGELKTKPTQHSVKELRSIGIQPDILLCRADRPIPESELQKIALFCNVSSNYVIPALDQKNIYRVLLEYHYAGLDARVLEHFGITAPPKIDLTKWRNIVENVEDPTSTVRIAIVGKYNGLRDAYKSLIEAFDHAGIYHKCKVELVWVDSEEEEFEEQLQDISGIMVPGGFGTRGIEGKIRAIKFARENNVPYFGICYGMQLATIEIARNVLGIKDATSHELSREGTKIIDLMESWDNRGKKEVRHMENDMGGTMRLGLYKCSLTAGTKAHDIYKSHAIKERHRHRYELNIEFKEQLEKAGIVFSGISPDGLLPEVIELQGHRWFIGVQFHPELCSRPFEPHPLFVDFVREAMG